MSSRYKETSSHTRDTARGREDARECAMLSVVRWNSGTDSFLCLHCLGLGLKCHQKAGSRNKLLGRSWSCGPAVAAAPSTGPPPDNECKWLPSNIIFTSDWGAAASTRTTLKRQSFCHEVVGSRNSWDRFKYQSIVFTRTSNWILSKSVFNADPWPITHDRGDKLFIIRGLERWSAKVRDKTRVSRADIWEEVADSTSCEGRKII